MLPALAHVTFRGAGPNRADAMGGAQLSTVGSGIHPVAALEPSRPAQFLQCFRPCHIARQGPCSQYCCGRTASILWVDGAQVLVTPIADRAACGVHRCGRGRQHRSKHRRHSPVRRSGRVGHLARCLLHSLRPRSMWGSRERRSAAVSAPPCDRGCGRGHLRGPVPLRGHDTLALGAFVVIAPVMLLVHRQHPP